MMSAALDDARSTLNDTQSRSPKVLMVPLNPGANALAPPGRASFGSTSVPTKSHVEVSNDRQSPAQLSPPNKPKSSQRVSSRLLLSQVSPGPTMSSPQTSG